MKKCLLPIASAILGSSLTIGDLSLAQTNGSLGSPFISVEELSSDVGENVGDSRQRWQTTSVSQLSDIQPTDWAYQALQSLVERYGCVAGYPDGRYRGNRALTRYEFAAGLNACLDRINELIASATSNVLDRDDINRLLRLQDEYAPELATLRGRVDALEALTAELEANQFSTTAKLFGSASFTFTESWNKDPEENLTFGGSASLNFDTSFTGRDLLRAGLTGSGEISWGSVFYRFPLGFRGQFYLVARGQSATSVVPSLNPVSSSPIYGLSSGGGVGINYQLNDWLEIGATYFGSDDSISDPSEGKGLFNGKFGALAQVTLTPNDRLGIGLTYARYYAPNSPNVGRGGSSFAGAAFGEDTATSANAYGIEANYRFSDSLIAGAWVGYTEAKAESSPGSQGIFEGSRGAEAELWYWGLGLAFPDVGKLGSQLSFLFRMEPKVTENDLSERIDPDTGLTIAGTYSYPLTDRIRWNYNLSVQINPESDSDNDSIWEVKMGFTFSL